MENNENYEIRNNAPESEEAASKTYGLASLIIGAVSLVSLIMNYFCFSLLVPFSVILAIIALVSGIVGMKKAKAAGVINKQAKLGTVLSAVTVGIGGISMVVYAVIQIISELSYM